MLRTYPEACSEADIRTFVSHQMTAFLFSHEPAEAHLFTVVRNYRILLPHRLICLVRESLSVEIEPSPLEHVAYVCRKSRARCMLSAVRIVLRQYEIPVFISLVRHSHPQLVYILKLQAAAGPFHGKNSRIVHACRLEAVFLYELVEELT